MVATPFAFAVYGVDRGEIQTDRRIEMMLDAQIRDGLLKEIAELDRRYRLSATVARLHELAELLTESWRLRAPSRLRTRFDAG